MADNIEIDIISAPPANIDLDVIALSAASINIEYSYPAGPIGPAGINTWGSITGTLSAQTDLWNILSASSPGDIDVNTLVHTNSAYWNTAYAISTAYQEVSSSFATNTLLESTSALLTPLTLTNTLTSQLVLNTDSRLSDNRYPTTHALSHGQSENDSLAVDIHSLDSVQIVQGNSTIPTGFVGRTNDYNGYPQWFGTTTNNSDFLIAYRSSGSIRWVICGVITDSETGVHRPDFDTIYSVSIGQTDYPWGITNQYDNIQTYTNEILLRSGAQGSSYLNQYGSRGLAETFAISDHTHPLPTTTQIGAVSQTDFNTYKTSVAASTATLLPTTVYQNTSGNFIQIVNGTVNQINTSKVGSTVTLSFPSSAIFPGNVTVNGNLTIAGSATYVNTNQLVVGDNLIYLNNGYYGGDDLDTGFVSHFTKAPIGYQHTGLVRRAGGVWTLFSGLTTEPLSASNLDWSDPNIYIESLSANILGNLSGSYVTVGTGNSDQWNQAYMLGTAYQNASGSFLTSIPSSLSGNWSSAYASTTALNLSSSNWNSAYINQSNYLPLSGGTMSGNLIVNASFAAQTKSFLINHPSEPNKKLQYGSLESPYHGIRLTGKDKISSKQAIVQLPEYIKDLVREDDVNIQLTNYRHSKNLFVKDINVKENYFTVGVDKKWNELLSSYEFFWSFTAIRKDIPKLEVEI